MLRLGSLFSGIGGLDLGLERAGMRTAWMCERDPYARAVLEERWPGVPIYEDVRTLRGAELAPVDVLAGGFPCQDISSAGKRAGLSGPKSSLWWEFDRLVGELRPRFVVVENVGALAQRGLDRVLGALAERGYDAEWATLRASDVGATQRRARLFIVAYADDEPGTLAGVLHGPGGRAADAPASGAALGPGVAHADGRGHVHGEAPIHAAERGVDALGHAPAGGGPPHVWPPGPDEVERWRAFLAASPGLEPAVRGGPDGLSEQLDRLRVLGNAVVPQVAELVGRRVVALAGGAAR